MIKINDGLLERMFQTIAGQGLEPYLYFVIYIEVFRLTYLT